MVSQDGREEHAVTGNERKGVNDREKGHGRVEHCRTESTEQVWQSSLAAMLTACGLFFVSAGEAEPTMGDHCSRHAESTAKWPSLAGSPLIRRCKAPLGTRQKVILCKE